MKEKQRSRILIIILVIGFYSCSKKQKTQKKIEGAVVEKSFSELKGFELLQDFEKSKAEFGTPNAFEINDFSTDGGELKVFSDKDFNYIVFDFWLYGETGKLNYTYWMNKNESMEFKFIKQLKYEYDKPYYAEGFKTDSIIRYMSYSGSKTKLYDANKTEITEPKQIEKSRLEMESFFIDVSKGIKIVK